MRKDDFPIFKSNSNLVYLDTAATAQKPQCVIEALSHFYESSNANIHRGLYKLSEKSTRLYDDARLTVADFIGADFEEIIFVRNATEGINLVRYAWADKFLKEGDTILVSILEHHSNFVPWLDLASRKKLNLKVARLGENVADLIDESVKLVCVTHLSNSLGCYVNVKPIIEKAHSFGAKILIDAAQAISHVNIDVKELDADFLVFSGHKLYGPTGIGVLYAKKDVLEEMDPFMFGGDMIKFVEIDKVEYAQLPNKFEAGTPNIAGAIGLAAAVDYLNGIGMAKIYEHDRGLCEYAVESLGKMDFIKIVHDKDLLSAVAFVVDGVHPHDVAQILSDNNIAVRAGHHCTQPLMKALGEVATVRFSFGLYNEIEDIDKAVDALYKVKQVFHE